MLCLASDDDAGDPNRRRREPKRERESLPARPYLDCRIEYFQFSPECLDTFPHAPHADSHGSGPYHRDKSISGHPLP